MKKIRILALAAAALFLAGCGNKGPSELETARDAGITYMEQANYEQAVASFEQAYALCDNKMPETKTDISLYEAACQLKMQDYEGVVGTCSRILELGENADAYYMRGEAFLKQGNADAAKADFDGASLLEPGNYEMYLNIYRLYEAINQSAVGDEYLQKALNYEGAETEDDYQKGGIYFCLGDYGKAQQLLAKPVEDKYEPAMMLMGQVYLEQQDSTRARNVYQQYLETYGETALVENGLALCDIADQAYDAALEKIEKGLTLEPDDSVKRDLLFNRIVAYEKKLDFETAKQCSAEFAELYPEDQEGKKENDFLITR